MLAPHFRQTLIILIMVGVARALPLLYSVKFSNKLRFSLRREFHEFALIETLISPIHTKVLTVNPSLQKFVTIRGIRVEPLCNSRLYASSTEMRWRSSSSMSPGVATVWAISSRNKD